MSKQFKHILIIANPKSTHYRKSGHRIIKEIITWDKVDSVDVYDISAKDYEQPNMFAKRISKLMKKDTILGVAGGDGTVSFVVGTLISNENIPSAYRKNPILPLWGGNANDLAYMANGARQSTSIRDVLLDGKPVEIYPLVYSVGTTKTDQLALCYLSIGASAYASHLINQPGHRNNSLYKLLLVRSFLETKRVLKALKIGRQFDCVLNDEKTRLYDLMFINGSRIAKIDRVPHDLHYKSFYMMPVRYGRPVILNYLLHFIRDKSAGAKRMTSCTAKISDAVWLQADGEVERLKKNTEIKVSLFEKPFYVISTKLNS